MDATKDEDPAQKFLDLGWPYPLAKSTWDQWDYVLGLKSGHYIHFKTAIPDGVAFVHLKGVDHLSLPIYEDKKWSPEVERGITVRLDEIAWVIDLGH